MLKVRGYCKVRIITDCNRSGIDDINETMTMSLYELRSVYYDLKNTSSVIIHSKRMTALNNNRLFSILLLDENIFWEEIINNNSQAV